MHILERESDRYIARLGTQVRVLGAKVDSEWRDLFGCVRLGEERFGGVSGLQI